MAPLSGEKARKLNRCSSNLNLEIAPGDLVTLTQKSRGVARILHFQPSKFWILPPWAMLTAWLRGQAGMTLTSSVYSDPEPDPPEGSRPPALPGGRLLSRRCGKWLISKQLQGVLSNLSLRPILLP